QYLIELPGGHVQALSIAWDTRPAAEGGQRWFHLYPQESVDSDDPLHWTGTYQSWNTMCADCHSTDLSKNYDSDDDTFATTWSSIDVDCEACHGPGSEHVTAPSEHPMVLGPASRTRTFSEGAVTASLLNDASAGEEIEVCAQCHSRRSQLTDFRDPGDAFLDAYRPALLDAGLYHADGQILDEVYVYGSFLQSAMHAAGVTCSDCHEPHSTATRAQGNALCGQCHLADAFDTVEHHHHPSGTPGAQCVSCHMRAQTYMVVDPRRDHSFRVPRPDLTAAIGTPNACGDCHAEQGADWASEQVADWFPDGRSGEFHYGLALAAGRNWSSGRTQVLRDVIDDADQPEIVRATALSLLASNISNVALDVIEQSLDSGDVLVQMAALDALSGAPLQVRIELGQRFLTHELRVIRLAAARALVPVRENLSERRQRDLDRALGEYAATQEFNSDRGEGLFNEASVLAEQGALASAEAVYLNGIEREPAFTATYVNLADLYRQTGAEDRVQALLREAIGTVPDDPGLNFSLGLSLVRTGELDEAITMIEQAASLAPGEPYYRYVLGVALNSGGRPEEAITVLASAHERFPAYPDIVFALATMLRDAGDLERAVDYAQRLLEIDPSDATARALLQDLEAAR
ncbi:MAG: tetratricopeptide repeat protein, partial [Gammaproteobacteria bacterium]